MLTAARFGPKMLAKSRSVEARRLLQSSLSTQGTSSLRPVSHATRIAPVPLTLRSGSIGKPKHHDAVTARLRADVDVALGNLFMGRFPLPHGYTPSCLHLEVPLLQAAASESTTEEIQLLNRNARRPNKANKGARPCSRASRRKKKEQIGKRKR